MLIGRRSCVLRRLETLKIYFAQESELWASCLWAGMEPGGSLLASSAFPPGKGPSGEAEPSGRFQGRDGDDPPVIAYSFEQADILNLLWSLQETLYPLKNRGGIDSAMFTASVVQWSLWEYLVSAQAPSLARSPCPGLPLGWHYSHILWPLLWSSCGLTVLYTQHNTGRAVL